MTKCKTTERIVEMLRESDRKGAAERGGVTVDREDYTADQWATELLGELGDAMKYVLRWRDKQSGMLHPKVIHRTPPGGRPVSSGSAAYPAVHIERLTRIAGKLENDEPLYLRDVQLLRAAAECIRVLSENNRRLSKSVSRKRPGQTEEFAAKVQLKDAAEAICEYAEKGPVIAYFLTRNPSIIRITKHDALPRGSSRIGLFHGHVRYDEVLARINEKVRPHVSRKSDGT